MYDWLCVCACAVCARTYSFDIHFIFGCYSSFCGTFRQIDTYFRVFFLALQYNMGFSLLIIYPFDLLKLPCNHFILLFAGVFCFLADYTFLATIEIKTMWTYVFVHIWVRVHVHSIIIWPECDKHRHLMDWLKQGIANISHVSGLCISHCLISFTVSMNKLMRSQSTAVSIFSFGSKWIWLRYRLRCGFLLLSSIAESFDRNRIPWVLQLSISQFRSLSLVDTKRSFL